MKADIRSLILHEAFDSYFLACPYQKFSSSCLTADFERGKRPPVEYLADPASTSLANTYRRESLLSWQQASSSWLGAMLSRPVREGVLVEKFYSRSSSVVSRLVGGETLIIPVRSGVGDLASIYSLNEVGSFIWRSLDHPLSADSLAALLSCEFDVCREQAQTDLCHFLGELDTAGLLAVTDAQAVDRTPSEQMRCTRDGTGNGGSVS